MKKTLLLVDGSSYLYRAYYAMPNLRNAQGHPTSAIYGVINMLKKLQQDYHADYIACIFDAKGKTFRDDIYSDYKSNRPPMPSDLSIQVQPLYDVVTALGWPLISITGVEADDVIGTLSTMASKQGIKTIISTGDKDLAQLVDKNTQLINTMNNETSDIQGVKDKFGVSPEQIIDFLMLTGDTADNIPGVPKVGEKTAAKLLNEYQSLENLIAEAENIKGVVGKNIREFIPTFDTTRKLVTIKTDCEIPEIEQGWSALEPKPEDTGTLIELYNEFGFRTWLRELTGDPESLPEQDARVVATADEQEEVVIDYHTILEWDDFTVWVKKIEESQLVALDTETDGLDPMCSRLVGISFAMQPGKACYIPLAHRGPDNTPQLEKSKVLEYLKPWLENPKNNKVLHNAKFDTHIFHNEGIKLAGIQHDTMLQAYVLEAHKRVGLMELSERWLGHVGTAYEDICGKGAKQIGFDELDVETASHYACEDADLTLQLHMTLYPQLSEQQGLKYIYDLEINVSRVLSIIEINGVALDMDALNNQSNEIGKQLLELEEQAHALAEQPFNLNSPKQVGEILFTKMELPIVSKTASGAPSTNEDVLTKLSQDYPLPKLLLQYRGLAKLKSTYTDKLPKMVNPETNRVHTRYSQAAVVTGRLASSDPNLQNIPVRTAEGRKVRTAFISKLGKVISADYSQIELRIMAHLSGDKSLCNAFHQGADIHKATASEIFGVELNDVNADQRYAAKAINFGLIYGMGEFGLAQNLDITRTAARSYIDKYFSRYPGVADYMEKTRLSARENGYVETVFGRRIILPELKGAKGPRQRGAERAAINAPVQGTAADLIKMAMVKIQEWIEAESLKSLMIMQVHDELVFDSHTSELELLQQKLPEIMSSVAELSVPLIAEVGMGDNWQQAH